jgi:hypothetical protein
LRFLCLNRRLYQPTGRSTQHYHLLTRVRYRVPWVGKLLHAPG